MSQKQRMGLYKKIKKHIEHKMAFLKNKVTSRRLSRKPKIYTQGVNFVFENITLIYILFYYLYIQY